MQATVAGGVAEVAWVVGTAWQGRGYASEAARALVGWLRPRVRTVVARAAGLAPTGRIHDREVRWAAVGSARPRQVAR